MGIHPQKIQFHPKGLKKLDFDPLPDVNCGGIR